MPDAEPITVAPLPVLPHPATLTHPGAPAGLLIAEAKRAFSSLGALRQSLQSGADPTEYALDPPGPSSLPPLPPIPLPPKISYRRPSLTLAFPSTAIPTSRPPIPKSSPLARATSVKRAVEAYNGICKQGRAEARYGDTAVYLELGDAGSAWAVLRGKSMHVASVKFYHVNEGTPKPIHAMTAFAPYRTLGKHLTGLDLSLPELLYRLLGISELVLQPCHYCKARLRVPDGLPYGASGWLPVTLLGAIKEETAEEHDGSRGRWVCWHLACEPLT